MGILVRLRGLESTWGNSWGPRGTRPARATLRIHAYMLYRPKGLFQHTVYDRSTHPPAMNTDDYERSCFGYLALKSGVFGSHAGGPKAPQHSLINYEFRTVVGGCGAKNRGTNSLDPKWITDKGLPCLCCMCISAKDFIGTSAYKS